MVAQERTATTLAAAVRTSSQRTALFNYFALGRAYQQLEDFTKSIEFHTQCLAMAKEMGYRVGEGQSYRNLGNAYSSVGDLCKSVEYHTKDLAIAKEVGERLWEAWAYGKVRNAHQTMGDFSKVIEYHTQHLEIVKEVGNLAGETRAARYGNIGIAYRSLGDVYQRRSSTTPSAWRVQSNWTTGRGSGRRTGTSGIRIFRWGTFRGRSSTTCSAWGRPKRWATGRGRPERTGNSVSATSACRVRQNRRVLRSTTCDCNSPQALAPAGLHNNGYWYHPHPSHPGRSPRPCCWRFTRSWPAQSLVGIGVPE
jgi:tetratricopeptide (TPR) repeat protein